MKIFIKAFCLIIIIILFLCKPSYAKLIDDSEACHPVNKAKAEMKKKVGVNMAGDKCIPADICLTWDYVSEHRYPGNNPSDRVHTIIEESFPGYFHLRYDPKKKNQIAWFQVWAPSPPEKEYMNAELKSIDAVYMGSRSRKGKPYYTQNKNDYILNIDPLDPLSFTYDSATGDYEGSITAPEALPEKIWDNIRGAIYHENLTTVTLKGVSSLTLKDILQGIKTGSIIKSFDMKEEAIYPVATSFKRTGSVTADIIVGVAGGPRKQRIDDKYFDMFCPDVYEGRRCFDISVDCKRSKIDIVVKIHLVTGQLYISYDASVKHNETMMQQLYGKSLKGNILEVSKKDLADLAKVWEKEIEDTWNNKFKFRRSDGKGKPVDITFDVQFVDDPDICFIVIVMPESGRSDETTWYAEQKKGTAAHEFGHMLGLLDEYSDRDCPQRPIPGDDNIMKKTAGKPMKRHFESFGSWAGQGGGVSWEPVSK